MLSIDTPAGVTVYLGAQWLAPNMRRTPEREFLGKRVIVAMPPTLAAR